MELDHSLKQVNFDQDSNDFSRFLAIFESITERHAPTKSKLLRGNDAPFMTKTNVLSQFNYCPLVWHFCGNGSIHKMEKIQERALRFVFNDYMSEYKNLLHKNVESTLYLKRVRVMAQEVYKAINNQSPKYIKELLSERNSRYSNRRPLDLYIPRVNQQKFGYRSYTFEAPSVWNSLPLEIRKAENFHHFKKLINSWSGPSCRCNFCIDSEDDLSF